MDVATFVLVWFFIFVLWYVARNAKTLFSPRHGRRHRLCGGAYLAWLLVGVWECWSDVTRSPRGACLYDATLGALGTMTTLTAAWDFGQHKTSDVSGTLDEQAYVTRSEMLEHSFYQILNLIQIIGLHCRSSSYGARWAPGILFSQTALWLVRDRFPVNSFSANYDERRGGGSSWTMINIVYRIKKYQYIFYKHALLHGLNLSTCLARVPADPARRSFRVYWLCLNAAYTHEFFLQTLVKRKVMPQPVMLALNKWLMLGSSVAATKVLLRDVRWPLAVASWALNMTHRGHDCGNTLGLAAAVALAARWQASPQVSPLAGDDLGL